jgi:hypothetical protein
MFILKNLNIEAKRTSSLVQKFISKRTNMFICKNLNIEAKRSKLMLNCECSEVKLICSIVETFFQSEAVMFISKNLNIEVKRTGSIVILYFKKRKKQTFVFFINKGQKTKGFDSKLSKFCHS